MPSSARIAALLLAVAATGTVARTAELPNLSTAPVPGWSSTALFRSTLAPGSSLAVGLPPLAPDIDFTTGRELAVAGMSERDVFVKSFLTPRLNSRRSTSSVWPAKRNCTSPLLHRSHGIIKPVSRTNQDKGKALPAGSRNLRRRKGERAVVAHLNNKGS